MKFKTLEEENAYLKARIAEQDNHINYLENERKKLLARLFGRKSERYIPQDPSQLKLDLKEGEDVSQKVASVNKSEPKRKTIKSSPKEAMHPVRKPIPADIPRAETEIIEPEDLPVGSKRIGEEITEVLECIPAQLYVRVICRPKYATPDGGVVIAEMPDMAFAKSNAGASLIASVLTGKYVDHLPLHRQGEIFARGGYEVSSSTMTNWVQHGIEKLKPLYNHIVSEIRSSDYVQVDETTMPVLKSDREGAAVKGYMWAMRSPLRGLTAFHWDGGSRSARTLVDMMGEFQGGLQSDGYNAYNVYDKVKGMTLLGCWAHARRKFYEAKEEYPALADEALTMIGNLYEVEREASDAGLSAEQRQKLREEKSHPVIKEFQNWMEQTYEKLLPKSRLASAILYTANIYPRLARYVTCGDYNIDNNGIENAIRPIALGRKNYLYCGNDASAERTAVIYTIVACCRAVGVNPFDYLTYILPLVDGTPPSQYGSLLPANCQNLS